MNTNSNIPQLLDEAVARAFARSARAFSDILDTEVTVKERFINRQQVKGFLQDKESDTNGLQVIKTPIIGELVGESHLWLTEDDIVQVVQQSTPVSATDLSEISLVMEIDNIVSAAFLSEISNEYNLNIYGGVPEYTALTKELSLTDYFEVSHGKEFFFADCFVFGEVEIYFTWTLAGGAIAQMD